VVAAGNRSAAQASREFLGSPKERRDSSDFGCTEVDMWRLEVQTGLSVLRGLYPRSGLARWPFSSSLERHWRSFMFLAVVLCPVVRARVSTV
jgi:hypothetical protein